MFVKCHEKHTLTLTETQQLTVSFIHIGSYPKAIERPTATCRLKVEIKQPKKEDYRKHKGHS